MGLIRLRTPLQCELTEKTLRFILVAALDFNTAKLICNRAKHEFLYVNPSPMKPACLSR